MTDVKRHVIKIYPIKCNKCGKLLTPGERSRSMRTFSRGPWCDEHNPARDTLWFQSDLLHEAFADLWEATGIEPAVVAILGWMLRLGKGIAAWRAKCTRDSR
jgi:hypothetical protein